MLTGSTEAHPDMIRKENTTEEFEIQSCWHPNITINLIEDYTPWQRNAVPAPLNDYIRFSNDGKNYWPILYFNDYWNLNVEYMPINDTTTTLTLHVTFAPM